LATSDVGRIAGHRDAVPDPHPQTALASSDVPVASAPEQPALALPDPLDGGLQRPVSVFAADPDLLTGIDPGAARVLRDRAIADSVLLEEGPWTPPAEQELGPGSIGLLVVDGLLSRTVRFDGLESPELVGAGDLLRPWEDDASAGSLEFETDWRVLDRATVALLDERFARELCRVPGVMPRLLGRAIERCRWLSFQLAIAHVRRAEARVVMLFWHLADRWGRVTPRGIVVPLRLTHATVARLVCMRRPTVSATLTRLARTGELERNEDGTWTLNGEPPDLSSITRRHVADRREAA
jgi:CRP/FNR family cyclic AMP-dependent transcriptional regulator